MTPDRVMQRALRKVEADGDCIVSLYSVGTHGYAQIGWFDGERYTMTLVHRVVWEHHNGVIPADLTIDHLCRNRRCCRIDHLRLLPNEDNARDNGNYRKTHCPHGHEYDDANTYVAPRGDRRCRACARDRRRR